FLIVRRLKQGANLDVWALNTPIRAIDMHRSVNRTKESGVLPPSIGTGEGKQVRCLRLQGRRERPSRQFGLGLRMRSLRMIPVVPLALRLATDTPPRCRS